MAKYTFLDQETGVRKSTLFSDAVVPSLANYQTTPTNLEEDLNNLRSQIHNVMKNQAGNWYDDLTIPSALDTGVQRGVDDLNNALHAVEKKRILRDVHLLTDVTVGAGNNFLILGATLPSNTTAAVGAVTTLGTVLAPHGGVFGSHSLAVVAGPHALNPQNLMEIVDGATRDPILSAGAKVYGLLHGESGLTDGVTMTALTTTRAQISFVRPNAAGSAYEAVPFADIAGKVINYCTRERVRLEDLNESDFLRGGVVDVGVGATVDRQTAYTNQGTTPVDLVTNATLDLEGPGLVWSIRDDLQAAMFSVLEGSAGGTSEVQINAATDIFNVDAVANNFLNGSAFDTGAAGTTINVGVTPNQIDAGGSLKLLSTGADLALEAGVELKMTDSYRAGSTWSLIDGIRLADSSAEWSAYETAFGEVSLLNAIQQAGLAASETKTCAQVTSNTNADIDVGGTAGGANLDAQIHSLALGNFVNDHDVFHNGQLLRSGATAAANFDVYPGTSLTLGQLKFEFKVKNGDVLCVKSRA